MVSVSILGGGISGLSAAHFLMKRGIPAAISLFEENDRFGGWIKSKQISRNEEEFFFECGPRTLRPRGNLGNTTLALIEEVGLEDKVLPIRMGHPAAKNRMIYAKNQVCLLPNSPAGIIKTIPPFTKPLFLAGIKDIFTGGTKLEDESIHAFAKRRFGQEVADYAIGSLICGICAGDAKEISVNFLLKDLFKIEQKYGGVVRGAILHMLFNKKKKPNMIHSKLYQQALAEKWAIYSMKGGLETIPLAMSKKLGENKNVNLQLNTRCQELFFKDNGEIRMRINDEHQYFNHLISSIPSYQLAELVQKQHPQLANELRSIQFVNVAVINLQYNACNLLKHNGFGVLVPPIEQLPILGIIFDSCCFDIKNSTVLTAMMGGRWFKEYFGDNPTKEHLLEVVLKNVDKILGIKEKPDLYNVNILYRCIPQYVTGHKKRVENIQNYIRDKKLPISLAGASYNGVGVNDVILSSKELVKNMNF